MEQLFDIAYRIFDLLLMLGVYINTNPVQFLIGAVCLVILLFVIGLVLRLFLSFKVFLLLVLGIVAITVSGQYIFYNTDLFDSDEPNTDTLLVTDLLDPELIERINQSHKLIHTHSDSETLILAGGGSAPKLGNKSYSQGLGFLRQQAASFSGEYVYIFRTDFDGKSYWTKGVKVEGLNVDYSHLFNSNLDAESLVIVHTHPDGSLGDGSHRMPPSLLDIITGIRIQQEYSIPIKHVVVESDRLWEYDFSNQKMDVIKIKLNIYLREVAYELEPIYACELIPGTQNCDTVTDKDRKKAIERLLYIYKDMGIKVTEKKFTTV